MELINIKKSLLPFCTWTLAFLKFLLLLPSEIVVTVEEDSKLEGE